VTSTSHSIRPQHPRQVASSTIAQALDVEAPESAFFVTGVASSSSDVSSGDVFFALPGAAKHGAHYASVAREAGAAAIVTDAAGLALVHDLGIPVFVVENPRSLLGPISALVYGTSESHPQLFGITGTNGKTTAVYLLRAVLDSLGLSTGLTSTSERIIGQTTFNSRLTTPEANEMHAFVALMSECGVTHAVLEVSAHALSRSRVAGLHFDVVGFTNFSQDHLDDYSSMDEYFAAKQQLFTPECASRAVIVNDSDWTERLVTGATIPVTTVGLGDRADVDWHVHVTERTLRATAFTMTSRSGESLSTSVPMAGDYSAVNAALALVMCLTAGFTLDQVAAAVGGVHGINVSIPGRTEIVSGSTGPTFFVDYGHTPEAFATTLAALRPVTRGRLIMVCGADGDRDTTKRHAMGLNAAQGSDVLIITDYHPRTEDPAAIRAQLLAGARSGTRNTDVREEPDPRAAVRLAVSLAHEGDTILYAGPGHEDYRDVGSHRIEYSARDDARLALKQAGW